MSGEWILYETFDNESLDPRLHWRYEPEDWFIDTDCSQLSLETGEQTDYWQKTHYGFEADNGHFLYMTTWKNFRMTTGLHAVPRSRYDQAGLMIRNSENVWVKSALEYIPNGPSKLGAVVTNNGYSDWSTQYVSCQDVNLYLRISKIAQNCYVDFSWDGQDWKQIRIAHLDVPAGAPVALGLYACSPQGKEQSVRFDFLTVEELSDDPQDAYL
ncbi:DUF1349 domain-containing protein [Alicyclobacillus sp. SO9]|uniref:DUF1349 domain-containing protein n=1 Tax=Alicyclobacillus sp. SO9 TaxID=2665646 RepID=UPI0018E86CA5|nr:DUF1349 domain-containing protein [Alicyclobacillus sp. SO9]QQE77141.1 DUF1349 domain-containing protein [Alicyclobacillus sp. SO9]